MAITQKEEVKILRKIVNLTSSDLNLNAILKEIVKVVNDITKADSVFIYLFDEKKRNLTLMASKVPRRKALGKLTLRVGEGITGWVAKQNQYVVIEKGAYCDSRFKSLDVLPEDQYEAFLSVPIIYKKKAIGVINIQHRKPHHYAPSVVALIDTIAKQVGGVVEHALLYDAMRKKASKFDSLIKVSESITSERYLDEILNLIVVVTAEMLDSKICSIMLLSPKKNELVIKATQSLSEAYRRKPNIKVDSSISGESIRTRSPVVVYDVREEERYLFRDLAKRENLTSMVAIPMIVKKEPIGVINVYTRQHHYFTEEEINVLQIVANQAAVAVENTKLMEESMKAREALETRKLIERAKSILMRINNLNEETAYRLIHKKSMDSGKTMKEIAESILLMAEFHQK